MKLHTARKFASDYKISTPLPPPPSQLSYSRWRLKILKQPKLFHKSSIYLSTSEWKPSIRLQKQHAHILQSTTTTSSSPSPLSFTRGGELIPAARILLLLLSTSSSPSPSTKGGELIQAASILLLLLSTEQLLLLLLEVERFKQNAYYYY